MSRTRQEERLMYANGFFEQKRRSPVSLAAVLGLHVAALGAVIMFGTTTFVPQKAGRMTTFDVPIPPPPPPVPPPPTRDEQTPRQIDRPTVAPTDIPPVGQITGPVTPPQPYQPPQTPPGPRVVLADATPIIPRPVRRAAEVDPRFRDALQPPYPPDKERAQQEGRVQVRVTVGTDGRGMAIEQ